VIQIIHHQVRNAEKNNAEGMEINTSVQGYANAIHSDIQAVSADDLFKKNVTSIPELKDCDKGRYVYINVWRNISDEPIQANPLAVLDEQSAVAPDDYIISEFYSEGVKMLQTRLNAKNAYLHKWYYYPNMTKNEALLFKHYDSDPTLTGRLCFHTAFSDPTSQLDAPSRESIEVRAYIYFPDHLPNTCPEVVCEEEESGDEEKVVKDAVKKLLGLFQQLEVWPPTGLIWLKGEIAKGDAGLKEIASVLALDEQGYQGLKTLPIEVRKKIGEELYADESFKPTLLGKWQKVKHRVNTKQSGLSVGLPAVVFVAVLSVGAGWALGQLRNYTTTLH